MTNDKSSSSRARVAVVTGANGAIGKAIAQGLAAEPGWEVVLVCRDAARAAAAAREIRQATGNDQVRYALADLSRRPSIEALADRLEGPLHVLVNNAATTPRRREETPEGIERQFATNVLGYFRMIRALRPHLRLARGARVVNVASYWAGGLDLDDLEFRRRGYDNDQAYRQSKQADRMLSAAFAERLDGDGITVNACHPGDVPSTLAHNLGFGGHETPAQAAATPLWLAIGETGGAHTGGYFEHQRQVDCPYARDREALEALFQACLAYP